MGYTSKLETLSSVKVTVPEGHPLESSNPITFGPFEGIFTEREILQEELRILTQVEEHYRELVAAGRLTPVEEDHQVAAYRQYLMDLLNKLLSDAEPGCPSSRHDAEGGPDA